MRALGLTIRLRPVAQVISRRIQLVTLHANGGEPAVTPGKGSAQNLAHRLPEAGGDGQRTEERAEVNPEKNHGGGSIWILGRHRRKAETFKDFRLQDRNEQ